MPARQNRLIVLLLLAVPPLSAASGSRSATDSTESPADHSASLEIVVTDLDGTPLADAAVFLDMPGLAPQDTAPAVMDQRNRQFLPYVLLVSPGDKVDFPNSDNIRHHVYSFSPAKRFELKLYSGASAEPVEFDKPGLVTLGCNIHDWMLGFVLVRESARRGVTDENGRVLFKQLPVAVASVKAWHPRLGTSELIERELAVSGESRLVVELDVGPKLRREAPDLNEQLDRQRDRRR